MNIKFSHIVIHFRYHGYTRKFRVILEDPNPTIDTDVMVEEFFNFPSETLSTLDHEELHINHE